MTVSIDPADILLFNKDLDPAIVAILIKDGLAMARQVAPCIDEEDFPYTDAAVAIIRGAVIRWAESGPGGVASEARTAGPFSVSTSFDTRQTRRSLFFPSEIRELEALCKTHRGQGIGAIDTLPDIGAAHCVGEQLGMCTYMCGSTNAPCDTCGRTLRPGATDDHI